MLKRRLILLVPLLALFAFVATTEKRAEAADTTPPETAITSAPDRQRHRYHRYFRIHL